MQLNTDILLDISRDAGVAILKIYNDLNLADQVDYKSDDSPLTLADQASHEVIMKGLREHYPQVPILSEEGGNIPYEERKHMTYYWCVDPLDGTKEFINRNGEFTVNIALIHDRKPVAGFIYAPVLDTFYYSSNGEAWKITGGNKQPLKVNNSTSNRIAVRSKSHPSPEEEVVLDQYDVVNSISVGSSLKFCMVAEGKADVYYRFGPTMEWDTAAGQAVLEGAGGVVYKETGPERFTYNKENLLNGSFLGLGF
ncbi:3'(2'),5'-bisphosphate nucleotidase CysQ [Fulvivirga sedimenti]|uniref:3'(2'),5'-bisphosphate nucleotidase CysQ n=1 Tax=Fulvivirga sedimenti TaxID=2879465 RepID=A0A9X1HWW5_9BACT|nr:3'(2'),5'-bisphosphate nucleotidase CysQ [Fulvivirga sedimenti]MCA6078267.1 3'(2'),5'-bisphosphate nucleotidase CysQ [Fulvivirga sedimenti]